MLEVVLEVALDVVLMFLVVELVLVLVVFVVFLGIVPVVFELPCLVWCIGSCMNEIFRLSSGA